MSDKLLQRRALRAAGVPGRGTRSVPESGDHRAWQALEREARFPAVLKPRRGEASHDTSRVDSFAELRARVEETPPSRGTLLLEEFLSGRPGAGGAGFASYVSVETIVCRGRISHLAITGRPPFAEPFRETGAIVPSAIGDADAGAVLDMASASIEALGLSSGCVHTELSLTADGPRVIEINSRVGGIPTVIAAATGVDLLAVAFRLAIGEDIEFRSPPPPRRWLPTGSVATHLRKTTAWSRSVRVSSSGAPGPTSPTRSSITARVTASTGGREATAGCSPSTEPRATTTSSAGS